ncbi:hypothetical protein N8083_00825 [Candidatus Pacebacteria bacterium]|nr:hypothetical protein [Candidatus Paceibacterota bacterium]
MRYSEILRFRRPRYTDELQSEILRLLLSKKFRKYSANEELITHCKEAIALNVAKNEPINITFLHGAYKLWRLEESPCVDWAELFSLMYYMNWVKGICEIYEPGVWFDFFADDWIIPKLDNVPMSDIENYLESYNALLAFLKPYQPKNLNMTITPVGSQFESMELFDEQLTKELEKLNAKGLPELTDELKATIELNTKTTAEQKNDPVWREKVWQLHLAYSPVKKLSGYYDNNPKKILAFTQPLPSGKTISVGTTKSSVMKFWIGVGALQKKGDSYIEKILSPAQLTSTEAEYCKISIKGLAGKNFENIRVV